MTLIVGVKCSDGVVLGADGAATFENFGINTARQPTKKLSLLNDWAALGVSGFVGLGQRIAAETKRYLDGTPKFNKLPHELNQLSDSVRVQFKGELEVAEAMRKVMGPQSVNFILCRSLLAVAHDQWHKAALIQFYENGSSEEVTDELPFVAVGSGQLIADPFMAFLRRVFWKDSRPNLAGGVFAAVWTLFHTIETNPGGVAEPVQIVVLEKRNGVFVARELPDGELKEPKEHTQHMEDTLRKAWQDLTAPPPAGTPEPPVYQP